MIKKEIDDLVQKYYVGDGYQFPLVYTNSIGNRCVDLESGKILYSLIRHFKPTNGLDFGGGTGFSSAVANAAMIKNGSPFSLVVSERNPDLLGRIKNTHKMIFPDQRPTYVGDITHNLEKVPKYLDFAFIDTEHDEGLTYWYLAFIFPRLSRGALVANHDWPVWEDDFGCHTKGNGVFPETRILLALYKEKILNLTKLYWTFGDEYPSEVRKPETGFWMKG